MTTPAPVRYATPIRVLLAEAPFPTDFVTGAGGLLDPLLDNLYYTAFSPSLDGDTLGVLINLVVLDEVALELPGLDGFQIVLGGDSSGFTRVRLGVRVGPKGIVTSLSDVRAALRFPREILKPVDDNGTAAAGYAQIEVHGSFLLDESFDLHVTGFDALTLKPSMIGDSGIIIDAENVKLDLSRTGTLPEIVEAGFDESFLGVFIGAAKVKLPPGLPELAPEDLVLKACAIGSGGVSGTLTAEYADPGFDPVSRTYQGRGAGDLFGVPFAVKRASIEVKQNALVESTIEGQMLLPFFDKRVNVAVGFDLGGGLSVELAGAPEPGDAYDETSGLLTLERPGVLRIDVHSLRFEVADGDFRTKLGGVITPLIGDVEWPTLQVTELAIDSHGNVAMDGGWLNLPEHPSFSFHGFRMEVTKLGFGNSADGGRWLGLSGGIKLVDEITAGASVDGLRLTWYPDGHTSVSFDGVGVELTIPKVLHFAGKVAYKDGRGFEGALQVQLIALDLEISGSLRFGRHPDGTYMALYLSTDLPEGIPLWATGLGLYGFAALFGKDMEPDRQPDEQWYDGWYKRPVAGVTDLATKWRPAAGSVALGAGVSIGTLADNGYAFCTRALFAIIFPGPIIMVEGRANLLTERAKLSDSEPIFRALGVIDLRADTVTLALDAHYKYNSDGKLIDLSGSAEAYFDRGDAKAWHVYLGVDEPRTKRIRAQLFKLFTGESYLMADDHSFRTGIWAGIDEQWKFPPFTLKVEAWIEAAAAISAKPTQFSGKLWTHGAIGVSIWRFGIDLEVDTHLEAEVFTPYHILGQLKVHIGLPWPLPDIDKTVGLEWGPDPLMPPLPLPLQAATVEHLKVTTAWPLARGRLLRPSYGLDGFRTDPDVPPAQVAAEPPPNDAPVVPLDCRPRLAFGRPVNDDALVAINPLPLPAEYERVGDPEQGEGPLRVRYGLRELALDAFDGAAWQPVARKVGPTHPTQNPPGLPQLYGSWAPEAGNTKLWLWSKTPFDFTAHGGGQYADWFTGDQPDYPCPSLHPDREFCVDFEKIPLAASFTTPWVRPMPPHLVIGWIDPSPQHLVELDDVIDARSKALEILPSAIGDHITQIRITLPEPAKKITLTAFAESGLSAWARQEDGAIVGPVFGGMPDAPRITLKGERLVEAELMARTAIRVVAVCYVVGPGKQEQTDLQVILDHLQQEMLRWSEAGDILKPHTRYRLKSVTTIDAVPEGDLFGEPPIALEQTEYAYFRTEGPPGLSALSVPDGDPQPAAFASGLDTLVPYVRQTLPEAVPGEGQSPNVPVRPVYRGYDIGVFFNENYVDLMYRAEGRDLGIYLFDHNDQRVEHFAGRLLSAVHSWQRATHAVLTAAEAVWAEVVADSPCVTLDPDTKPGDSTLQDTTAGRLLDPDSVYEVRLIPLLVRDEFAGLPEGTEATGPAGTLGEWRVADAGTEQAPSRWRIEQETAGRYVNQVSNVWGGTVDGTDPVKPGTVLLRGDATWSDYRFEVHVQSLDDDAVGVVFRYLDPGTHYRFSMDRERRYRRLVRVVSGVHTILAEDDFVYETGRDYALSVEAAGPALRIRQDGRTVFEVADATIDRGAIGLYCWANQGTRFHSVRVTDLRPDAPVPYRFPFTTSRYANFADQAHSFADRAALVSATMGMPTGVDPATPPTEDEAREYERLATGLGGDGPPPAALEVRVVDRTLWIRQPEPLRWDRLALALATTARWSPTPAPPGTLKLVGCEPGGLTPVGEHVDVLCRDTVDPTGYAVEAWHWPGPLRPQPAAEPLLADEFDRDDTGVVFAESGGPNALDKYTIVDEGDQLGPSHWTAAGEWITQTSPIFGGTVTAGDAAKPGTLAMLGGGFGNVRATCSLVLGVPGAIGLVFRRAAPDRWYRLSFDADLGYRRLIKRGAAGVSVLWEERQAVSAGQVLSVRVDAFGDLLLGYLDGSLLFAVRDDEIAAGGIGLYAWRCPTAEFSALRLETLAASPIAWRKGFGALGEVRVVDAPDAADDPSDWEVVAGGALEQHANLHDDADGVHRGTIALVNGESVGDGDLGVLLRSDSDGAIGVVFRYRGEDEYYRFSMRRDVPGRALVRIAGGTATALWQDGVGYEPGRAYRITLRLAGPVLSGYVDGVQVFGVADATFAEGQVGLYCWANPTARFDWLLATAADRASGGWAIVDGGDLGGPSQWRASDGVLRQVSAILGGSLPLLLGTHAIAGDDGWTDYRCAVDLRSDAAGAIGVLFRYRDEQNYYRFSVDGVQSYRRLIKQAGGVTTVLWQDGVAAPLGRSMRFVADAIGDRIAVYVDGERLLELTDDSHPAGRIGLYAAQNPGARFESVLVTPPPRSARALFADRFGAGSLAGFTVVDSGDQTAPSAWQAADGAARQTSEIFDQPIDRDTLAKRGTELVVAGHDWDDVVISIRLQSVDDDAIGASFRYLDAGNCYRFSMDSERSYRRLVKFVNGTASLLWESADGYVVGRTYHLVIVAVSDQLQVYLDDIAVCVVTDPDLRHGSVALYCWGNHDARFAGLRVLESGSLFTAWTLDETFAQTIPGRWDLSSRWQISAGVLDHAAGGSGTDFALLTAPTAGDHRVAARVRPSGPGMVGVVARFRDPDNYVALLVGPTDVRLVRRRAGDETDLAHVTIVRPDRELILTLTCDGRRLLGHLDGRLLADVDEPETPAGRPGLLCDATTSATTYAVTLAEPDWVPHYRFGPDRPQPSGTLIELRSDAVAAAPDPGEVRLPDHPRLRIVSALGEPEHDREFPPNETYEATPATVVRNRDGTSCFVIPASAPAPPKLYRLQLTFRRDNRAHDEASPVLSQGGDTTDEQATLTVVRPDS